MNKIIKLDTEKIKNQMEKIGCFGKSRKHLGFTKEILGGYYLLLDDIRFGNKIETLKRTLDRLYLDESDVLLKTIDLDKEFEENDEKVIVDKNMLLQILKKRNRQNDNFTRFFYSRYVNIIDALSINTKYPILKKSEIQRLAYIMDIEDPTLLIDINKSVEGIKDTFKIHRKLINIILIRKIMMAKGINRNTLAKAVGLRSVSSINRYINNIRRINTDNNYKKLESIANEIGINIGELLMDDTSENRALLNDFLGNVI